MHGRSIWQSDGEKRRTPPARRARGAALRVFLADLRHSGGGVLALDHMPLGIAYMKAVMDRDLPAGAANVRLFAYPDKLLAAIAEAPPDVLMVSNYVWNEGLSRFCLARAKQHRPGALTVMGGPNIALEPERQVAYLAAHPEIDVVVLGEGDYVAAELVWHLLECDGSLEALAERELPSSIYRRAGSIVRSETRPRARGLDDIPSPWLTGVLDEFFDGRLCPLLETNRGCPFRCSFCVQGTEYYNKVSHFDVARVVEELDYIGRRLQACSPHVRTLRLADPNFGMYKRDVEIAAGIALAQKKYGWPTYIDATTGKNKPEHIIECVEKVSGALVVYQAVQSLDEGVLRNINRKNIKLDSYQKVMLHVRGRGLRSMSDLILGLPGESLQSHLAGLYRLIDAGTHEANCFQAMMLKGSELEAQRVRDQYALTTRFRVLPKNFSRLGDLRVVEVEEIVVASDVMPFDDYLLARKHHLILGIFWNDALFTDVVRLLAALGVKASEWLTAMLAALEADRGQAGQLLQDFVAETRNELFDTRQACVDYYAQAPNFERLQRGEIGDNVLYKHRAKASFFLWDSICACAMDATRRLLEARGLTQAWPGFDAFWRDLAAYVEAKHAAGTTAEEVTRPVTRRLSFDLPRWEADGGGPDTARYRLGAERTFSFELEAERRLEIESAFKLWTAQLGGLTRLIVRIRRDSLARDCAAVAESVAG